jgi:hypothetical protein
VIWDSQRCAMVTVGRDGTDSRHYNPLSRKNQNDIIDSEQLVYLGDDSLCMLTPVHPSAAISLVLILQDAFLIYAACYIH